METLFASLEQIGLKVELDSPPAAELSERYLKILPVLSKEQIMQMAVDKKTDLFAGPLGIGKPKSEEVEMKGVKEFFKSYWYLQGCYECKWLKETSYPIPVPQDVIAIKFGDKTIKVKKEALTISDMLEKIGINLGPISLPAPILSGALKALGQDKVVGSSRHVIFENIIELHHDQIESELCLDALNGQEDKETLKLIAKANTEKIDVSEAPKVSKAYALERLKEKFKEIDEKIEIEAEGIVERKLLVKEINFMQVPCYEVTFETKQNKKSWMISAVNGKMEKK